MCDFSSYGGPSGEWLTVEASLPQPPANRSIAELKHNANQDRETRASKLMVSLSPQVHTRDYSIRTRDEHFIEARSYRPSSATASEPLPVFLYFHGGGFIFGTLESEDATCSQIAINVGVVVVNVNYRHTPEFTYPTAWNDAQDAFEWLHDHLEEVGGDGQRVVLGGISAGARLVASLVLEKRLGRTASQCPDAVGQVLMIPSLVQPDCYGPQLKKMKDRSVSSYVENENAPILPRSIIRFFEDLLKVEILDEADTKLNPGNATPEQVKGLLATVFGIAGLDPLRDEGLLYAKLLTEAGVPTNINLFKGVPHGFRRFGERLSESKRWDDVINGGIKWALSKPVATYNFDVKVE